MGREEGKWEVRKGRGFPYSPGQSLKSAVYIPNPLPSLPLPLRFASAMHRPVCGGGTSVHLLDAPMAHQCTNDALVYICWMHHRYTSIHLLDTDDRGG